MREGLFIKKNREVWEKIEHDRAVSADETASNFTRLVNDLAYAKTFYPGSKITHYLNALASRVYLSIYQNRKDPTNRLANFLRRGLPLTIARHYKMLLFALGVFLLFCAVGFFSAVHDKTFVRQMLGEDYVTMTEDNIDKGKPFGVYGQTGPFLMWIEIMLNNIRVCFLYFFQGLALGIPSMLSLGTEAIRIGAFEYMFYAHGLGADAVVTVLLHGMLELTAIIITCGAGLVMGTSWLFPGTRTRFKAFQDGARDGVKIMVALVPVLMVAAFIEGFITRHYGMELYLSLGILAASGTFIVWYFILYPFQVAAAERKRLALPHA